MMEQFAVFGDVHGESISLARALAYAEDRAETVVGLGDYVNRGSSSAQVLQYMVELASSNPARYIFLRGNHEVELLRFLETGDLSRFAAFGGLATIGSYVDPSEGNVVDRFLRQFPAAQLELLQSMPSYFESDDYLMSHAGFDPARPLDRSDDSMVMGSFRRLFAEGVDWPRELVVSGHYPQPNMRPFVSQHFISLDTGSGTYPDGQLSVLLLPSRTVKQFGGSNERS